VLAISYWCEELTISTVWQYYCLCSLAQKLHFRNTTRSKFHLFHLRVEWFSRLTVTALNFVGFGVLQVLEMDEAKKPEVHMTSAAAFVEGGIQDSCDDACSICLEEFCESDPSTVIVFVMFDSSASSLTLMHTWNPIKKIIYILCAFVVS